MRDRADAQVLFHNWWNGPRVWAVVQSVDPDASHASWLESFPWTRVDGVEIPEGHKPPVDAAACASPTRRRCASCSATAPTAATTPGPMPTGRPCGTAGVGEVRDLLALRLALMGWLRAGFETPQRLDLPDRPSPAPDPRRATSTSTIRP